MRLVVEIARLKARGAVEKVPIVRDLCQAGVEIDDLLPVKIAEVFVVDRGREDEKVYALFPAEIPDAGETLQGAGDGLLIHLDVGLGVVGEDGVGLQISVQAADALRVPHGFVIGPGCLVEDVKRLGKVGIVSHGLELIQAVAGVQKEILGGEGELALPSHLRGHGVGEGIRLDVVGGGVVQIDVDHDIFDGVVGEKIGCLLFRVQHVGAIDDHVVELGVQIPVQ